MKSTDNKRHAPQHILDRAAACRIATRKETTNCPENWIEDPAVLRWFRKKKKLNTRKELPEGSLRLINFWMPRYLSFHNKTPSELIALAKADPEDEVGETDLSDFYNFQLNEIKRKVNYAFTGVWSVLRGFYSHNGVLTKDWVSPRRETTETNRTDQDFPMFEKVGKAWHIKDDNIKPFLSHLSYRNQTICICLIQTGMDFEDLQQLTIGDVTRQPEEDYLYWTASRQKPPHIPFVSIFGRESSDMLRNYIKIHRAGAKSEDEPIFQADIVERKDLWKKQNKWPKRKRLPFPDEDVPFAPMTQTSLATCFRRVSANKLKIKMGAGKQQPYRPKRFRKIFRTACGLAQFDNDLIDAFMGHERTTSKKYLEMPREQIVELYKDVEPIITIYATISSNEDHENTIRAFN